MSANWYHVRCEKCGQEGTRYVNAKICLYCGGKLQRIEPVDPPQDPGLVKPSRSRKGKLG